ncbi:MAG: N-6 DNA methylase [Pyrinomonadaceae bacterium]
MPTLFDDQPYRDVLAGLRDIGYKNGLLQENYTFIDWFQPTTPARQINAVAFAQKPISYDSAVIGVTQPNGLSERALIDTYRALGAPIMLEVAPNEVREWAVSGQAGKHEVIDRYPVERIREVLVDRAPSWTPPRLLRTKNLGTFHWTYQLGLFAGLLPELEEQIQAKLEPLLKETLSTAKTSYVEDTGRQPNTSQLFQLVFWLLTAKVFHDRQVPNFISLGSNPDQILTAIAKHYRTAIPNFLTRRVRETAAAFIWSHLDFRNLSVEVLSQLWATFLIDDEMRRELGIHRTSRTIVRYVVEKIPFTHAGDDELIVFEPCSGSASFLIGAMNVLRPTLFGMSPQERHQYFRKHLVAMETEALGLEISRLSLTLSDFPNPNKWEIVPRDVFQPGAMTDYLQRAAVVLCNPPFGAFGESDRKRYGVNSPYKAVELLGRVLDDLQESGVLGFVLPRTFLDGHSYKRIRQRLAERFASLDITELPDRAFEHADAEVCLLIATEPIPHKSSSVIHRKVNDNHNDWWKFALLHETSSHSTAIFNQEKAKDSLAIPALPDLWDYLAAYPTLSEHAEMRRGIEWNKPLVDEHKRETGFRADAIRHSTDDENFRRGVAPKTKFAVFEVPHMPKLSLRPEDERGNSYEREWDKPKVIVNKTGRSRGPWKIAAFPDLEGVVFYQTFIGVWPTSPKYDAVLISAILNSPVANAFVDTREGKTDIKVETLELIPLPIFTTTQEQNLRALVAEYQRVIGSGFGAITDRDPARILMEIDAAVLEGYRLTPKLENEVLNHFRGYKRPASHYFGDYLPPDCEVYFSLTDHLSPRLKEATIGELLKRTGLA